MRAFLLVIIVVSAWGCNRHKDAAEFSARHAESQLEKVENQVRNTEAEQPAKFLKVEATMSSNLIGQKIFSGSISNTASMVRFENVEVTFHFLDSTRTEIGSHTFMTEQEIPAQKRISFKIKVFTPKQTADFNYTIKAIGVTYN